MISAPVNWLWLWLYARWVRCAGRQAAVGDLAHLAPRTRVEGSLAGPRQRLVHVSGFQNPEAANVLLGFQIGAIGDERFTVGLPPHRLRLARRAKAASHEPGTGSFQLIVEIVDSLNRRCGHCGRVEVVGEVIRKQIMRHDFSFVLDRFRKARLFGLHNVDEWADPNSTN